MQTSTSTELVPFDYSDYQNTKTNRVQRWAYEHPKTARISAAVISKTSSAGLTAIIGLAMTIYTFIGVAALLTATCLAYGKINGHSPSKMMKNMKVIAFSPFTMAIPSKHAMSTHLFKEKVYKGCKLHYEGDIPVLTLTGKPRECGHAHGVLLAKQIKTLIEKWDSLLWLLVPDPSRAKSLCLYLRSILPDDIREEMEGLVEGYNEKIYGKNLGEKLTLDKLLLLHLVPDIKHTFPNMLALEKLNQNIAMGCTTILDRGDEGGGPIVGRHMDWPSLDEGKLTLAIRRHPSPHETIHEISAPGLCGGTVTGMKMVKGRQPTTLALAMNVALGKTEDPIKGLPAIILNKIVLQKCNSVKEAHVFIGEKLSPLGPYHLSLADSSGDAKSIHFYQSASGQHYVRSLSESKDHIVTTNCRYNRVRGRYRDNFNSFKRHENVKKVYDYYQSDPPHSRKTTVEAALKTPLVNNIETTCSAVMLPKIGRMELSFGNAYAADNPRQVLDFPA